MEKNLYHVRGFKKYTHETDKYVHLIFACFH